MSDYNKKKKLCNSSRLKCGRSTDPTESVASAYDDNYRRRKALGKYDAIYIPADTYNLANAIILYIGLSVFGCICFVTKSVDNKIVDLSFSFLMLLLFVTT